MLRSAALAALASMCWVDTYGSHRSLRSCTHDQTSMSTSPRLARRLKSPGISAIDAAGSTTRPCALAGLDANELEAPCVLSEFAAEDLTVILIPCMLQILCYRWADQGRQCITYCVCMCNVSWPTSDDNAQHMVCLWNICCELL